VATIMLEIPDELNGLVKAIKSVVREAKKQVERGRKGQRVEYEQFEARLAERVAEVECASHQAALAALDVDAPQVTIDGVVHAKVGRQETQYKTRAGEVPVTRSLYREAGKRNARVVNAVSLRAQTVADEWLPGTARQMAYLFQQAPSREAEKTAKELGQLPYSRSSFERIGHEVGDTYLRRHQDIEEALIQSVEVPEHAHSISVSLDRVALPMEEPRPRRVGRPQKNAPKRPVARVFRQAYCGTVTLHDDEGNAVHTIRYGTMPDGDPATLAMSLAGDVIALRSKRESLHVSRLCDGAPEMWNLLTAEFGDGTVGEVNELIDYWHVLEKLAPAAKVIHPAKAENALRRWGFALLNRDTAAKEILAELHDSGMEHVRRGDVRPVHDAITYVTNNGHRMNYASARRRGLPIGSGNVEATCKSLVALRMKRPGARWKTHTGEHVLHLRALALSDRWDDAMALTLRRPQVKIRAVS